MERDAPTMTDTDPPDRSPADAFAALGHEHRVAILDALLDLSRSGDEYPASFSTLRERAGVAVSSQFSYHLDALVGHFLRRDDDGYSFRYAGWKVATAVLAGTYHERRTFGPAGVDGTCPLCGTDALAASYRDEWLAVDCESCGERLTRYPFPPGGLAGRDPAGFLRAFDRHVRSHVRLIRDGVCPACVGRMEPTTFAPGELPDHGRPAAYDCTRCGNSVHPPPGLLLLPEPRVRSFCRARGVDVDATPYWELGFCVDDDRTAVDAANGWRCQVTVEAGDDALVVELDGALDVAAAEERAASD